MAGKTATATIFFKVLLPISLLAAAVVRFNGLSGVYLLCLMALPLMPNPTQATMAGRTGIYMKILIILGSLACVTQLLFQVILLVEDPYGDQLQFCNGTESLWRQLGYQKLNDLDAGDISRLIVPDILVLVAAIVVFVACKVLLKPVENAEGEDGDGGEVYHRRQVRPSVVMVGIRSFCVMVLCALVAAILPSAISAFYFLSLLIVVTWWSMYQSWGSKFNIWMVLWLMYSGAHLILLYLYQFPFFQEALPPELDFADREDEDTFFTRLFGLTAIIRADFDCSGDPRVIDIVQDHPWPVYVNPALILIFYIYLATQVRVWLDGPSHGYNYIEYDYSQHEKVPRRRKDRSGEKEDEAHEQPNEEKKVPLKKQDEVKEGTKDGEKTDADGIKDKRLMSGSQASYQALDESAAPAEGAAAETTDKPELEREQSFTSQLSQDASKKLSPIVTLIIYCTKQCYLAALILMMAWSITYHSWLSFVLLLWACAIWIVPAGTTRQRALYTSPLLVLYAEALLIIQFVYGLSLNHGELPVEVDGVDLREIGLMKYDIPFVPLGVQLLYTCMFWLTLRQFLRERKLSQITDQSPGIVLQPFGMIFSGPNEEVPALTEQLKEGGDAPDHGESETMKTVGATIMKLFAKYWIFLCGAMFLIVSLEATVDIFKIIYMGLFLLIVNIFLLSFTLFRFISKPFAWIVVLYSVCTLVLIYTYQFDDFPAYWTDGTGLSNQTLNDLGLKQYGTSDLFVNLLIPTTFIIVFMVQLHYYHNHFLTISVIKPSGYKPGSLKEEDDEGEGQAINVAGSSGEEAKSGDEADKPKKKRTKSKLKHYTKYLGRSVRQYYIHFTRAVWRLLEIHMVKVVFFTVVIVVTQEVSAVNGIFILLIFLAMPFPSLFRLASLFTMLWASAVLFVKMVYQLQLVPVEDWIMDCNETVGNDTGDFPIKSNFSKVEWFGFEQVSNFSDYVIGYVAIILMLILQSIVALHQRQHRHENNLEKIKDSIVFPQIKRVNADEGLVSAFKFFCNYCFYKFGLEICFVTTVIVASIRLDLLGAVYMGIMICMVFSRRKTVATAWPFYAMLLVVLFPVAYALALGVPPCLCWNYPWTGKLPDQFITWLYFPDYLVRPDPTFILADFFQLLFVCLQWQVFRIEKTTGANYPGGDNYEATVDVENISENPVPNFTFNRSYLDISKTVIFSYGFWITLAIVFLAGTSRVSLLGLIYIIFSFYFLWGGQDFMIKPNATVFKQWNLVLGYNLFVIMVKVALQLGACAYLSELLDSGLCWLIQLLGVVCLQAGFDITAYQDECDLPLGEGRLVWDVAVFIFLLAQRRIFTSNYFQYIVLELEEEKRLASKGAELINELLAARVRNKRKEEEAILQGIKKKMQRIREKQAKLSSNTEYLEPITHGEAVRGAGGYYMFQNESEDDLSDLDPEINIENEIEEGPLAAKHRKEKEALEAKSSPWQLAFNAVMSTPEEALEKDEEKKKEADDDESYKDASDNALEASDGAAELDDAEDEFRSLVDEEDLEEEDGVIEKTESRLMLTWLIFMRLIDALVYQLDRISEEYRYVGRELRKMTSEGRKRRAQKKKRKAEAAAAATAEVKEESETGAADGDEIKVEEQGVEPHEATRVMIKEDPTTEVDRDHTESSPTADEIDRSETESQSTETGSSEKFERSLPRPVRLLYATIYALISQSQLFCYFLIVLNNLLSANIPSIVLPILVFLWAMLSVPRPTKRFWIFVITYTEIIVIFKYSFQFSFYPWNSEGNDLYLNKDNPLWWPRLFGIDQRSNYAVLDLCVLLAVFFHRSILKKHGLWQGSQVVPDIEGEPGTEQLAIETSTDKSADDTDSKKKKKKKKKKKEKKKKDKKEKGAEGEEAAAAKALSSGGDTSQDEDPGQQVKAAEPPEDGGGDKASQAGSEEPEEEKKSFLQPLKDFYNHMTDPTYTAVTDVYVPMFLCDLLNFLIVAFASWAFGESSATTDVTQLIMSNTIPTTFLILLIVQFCLMIIDRGIYLRKSVTGKFIFLIIMVVGVHVWFFFILPDINQRKFIDNTPAQLWYFFKCIYFGLSAFQVRSGYPTRILGNCLCKSYSLINLFAFMGWRAVPFLLELRILMDWMWTNTTLTLNHWVIVEDIFGDAYITKCWRKNEEEYPVPRGQQKGAVVKYAQGGGMLLGICLIIWFPLIIISLSNTNNIANPPSDVTVSLQFGGYQPLFMMSSQEQALQEMSKDDFGALTEKFDTIEARGFLGIYKAEDVYNITINGNSSSTWGISPPSREALQRDLRSTYDITVKFRFSFTRDLASDLVTPTVSNEVSLVLTGANRTIRDDIADQLDFTYPDPVTLSKVFPPYIKVPAAGLPEPVEELLPNGVQHYSDMGIVLQNGSIEQLGGGETEWWSVSNDKGEAQLTIITFNERVASELFAPLSSYGIIGLYISLVLVIGKFVRMMFSGVSFTIMFTEFPNVDRILKLCLDIYLVRECGEMELEEDLMAKLIFLYRSPETLIQYTKFKRD